MADRINQWNDLIKNHSWIPMLEEAIQNLPNLHTVMIHDERDPKAGPFYGRKDIGPFQHPHCILSKILAENAIAIQNYCLDFELGSAAEWYRAQKSLQALSLANPVTLRKLSVCMDVFTEHWTNPGHYSDSFSPVFPAVEELHLYHRNLSTTPVVVLNKFKRIIEADGIPGLKVLRLENVRMPHLDATQVCFLRSCETIILNEIAFSTVVDLRGCLQLLSDSASVKHIWLDHLYAFTPWVPFFKNRESVEEGQFHSNSRHPFDFSGVEDEIKRRTMRAGKILRWGKPPSRVSSTWEGGVSKDFIQDHSCLLFGSSRPVEM
ncbi:uncharacterized protein K460DRAFT_363817 [Cucurbitaria berberidis CBS 394.84]|uniref:Uncharacterized protein n=1 Tax=Cucurbitaria berberidis CBS 394.84 TaxID=1168544 RepID=A0A9P4GMI2_9PLEO|nr:uncharacterized protein K460DRAFT_363817 [Cucurbitaria berberidis CBS 394.84]KAF1847781.1 hypothetical protein K460DRAFT_363817 [Cucurbitaria berberidis CBS 394.84]